jgi:hypothetical protein
MLGTFHLRKCCGVASFYSGSWTGTGWAPGPDSGFGPFSRTYVVKNSIIYTLRTM